MRSASAAWDSPASIRSRCTLRATIRRTSSDIGSVRQDVQLIATHYNARRPSRIFPQISGDAFALSRGDNAMSGRHQNLRSASVISTKDKQPLQTQARKVARRVPTILSCEERQLVRVLLQGYVKIAKDGRQYHRFWSDMSNEENAARRILSCLILSGSSLPQEVREQLAALIDPINNRFPGITRRIKFRHRKQGGKNSPFNNSLIAMCVYKEVKNGRTVKEGCATAVEKFGMDERWIKKIWGRYRPTLEITDGPLPRPRPPKKK